MDHFGIGAAMRGIALTYFQTARRTGRTTHLVESVKDGDRIIFANNKEAERVKQLCRERGVIVDCISIDPNTPQRLLERGRSKDRSLFDHSWVEQRFLMAIEKAQLEIDELEHHNSSVLKRQAD